MTEHVQLRDISLPEHIHAGYNAEGVLLVKKFTLRKPADLARLNKIGVTTVSLGEGVEKGPGEETAEPIEAEGVAVVTESMEEFDNQVEANKTKYQQTLEEMEAIFSGEKETQLTYQAVKELEDEVDYFVDTVREQPASLAALTQLENYDDDTFQHSLNVCILAIIYGEYRQYGRSELRELGLGALLHDVGKTRLPLSVLHKNQNLSEHDWETIREHPERGRDLLGELEAGELYRKISYEHHERPDGSGYPEGTIEIHPYSRITSVCDVYEALTARRVYKKPLNPLHAFLELKNEFYSYPETRRVVTGLLRSLGLFPVGSIVELSNGALAVVKENHAEDLRRPTVVVVRSPEGKLLGKPYVINLLRSAQQKRGVYREIYDRGIHIKRIYLHEDHPDIGRPLSELVTAENQRRPT